MAHVLFSSNEAPLRDALSAAFLELALPHDISRLIVSTHPHDDLVAQDACQRACDDAGEYHLPILWTARDAWIGPVIPPAARGCSLCLGLWLRQPDEIGPHPGQQRLAGAPAASVRLPFVRAAIARHAASLASRFTADGSMGHPAREAIHLHADPIAIRTHHFLPHPDCPRCGIQRSAIAPAIATIAPARAQGFRQENPAITLDALRARYVDPECGLVQRLGTIDSTLMPMTGAIFVQDRGRGQLQTGIGRTGSRKGSERVAILEALERFAGSQAVAGAPHAIEPFAPDRGMIDPARFILHAPEQAAEPGYTLAAYRPDLPFAWAPARNVATGDEVLIPEQLIYYGQDPSASHQYNRFIFEISNGCALGSSVAEAALHGLFEVVERDAFLSTWYLSRDLIELDLATIDDRDIALMCARIAGEGFIVRCFDASTLRSIRAIIVAITDPDPATPFAGICASGAHPDPLEALRGALVEAASSFTTLQRKGMGDARARAIEMLEDDGLVRVMDDHMLLYSSPEAQQRLEFLFYPRGRQPFHEHFGGVAQGSADAAAALETAVRELGGQGYDVLVADQSFELLEDSGLHCVKTLVPGLLPMTFGHQYRRVDRARLAKIAGRDDIRINPRPHNFP